MMFFFCWYITRQRGFPRGEYVKSLKEGWDVRICWFYFVDFLWNFVNGWNGGTFWVGSRSYFWGPRFPLL